MSRTEELKKEIKELEEKIKSLQQELIETQKTEFDYPFNHTDDFYRLETNGGIAKDWWSHSGYDQRCYKQGNIFKAKKEAIREHYRRELLMRFKQFRDKCNGDWKPDFKNDSSSKIYIGFNHNENKMKVCSYLILEEFNLFGYFKNESDAERAIELFGDEIKKLYVEAEYE